MNVIQLKGREKPFDYRKGREISILDVKTGKNSKKTTFLDLDKKRCPGGAPGICKCMSYIYIYIYTLNLKDSLI